MADGVNLRELARNLRGNFLWRKIILISVDPNLLLKCV